LLKSGIYESFEWLGLTTTDADDYLAYNSGFPDVDYNAPPLSAGLPAGGLYTILSQKWFALNMIAPYELWTDWRRTDIVYGVGGGYDPGPTKSVDPNAGTVIPIRLFYPQNEYNYNAVNVGGEGNY
jgi:hypothetical protein